MCRLGWKGKRPLKQSTSSLRPQLSEAAKGERIKFACCDMSKAYIGAIKHYCKKLGTDTRPVPHRKKAQ